MTTAYSNRTISKKPCKNIKATLQIVALVLLVGCAANQPPQTSTRIKEAQDRYARLTGGMSREEVHLLLGEPQLITKDGVEQWHVQDGRYSASRVIRFAPNGKIFSIDDPGLFVLTH